MVIELELPKEQTDAWLSTLFKCVFAHQFLETTEIETLTAGLVARQ